MKSYAYTLYEIFARRGDLDIYFNLHTRDHGFSGFTSHFGKGAVEDERIDLSIDMDLMMPFLHDPIITQEEGLETLSIKEAP